KAGKSLFLLHSVVKLIDAGVVVLYFDYEMTEDDLYERLQDMGCGPEVDLSRLRYALLPTLPPLDTRDGGAALLAAVDQVSALHREASRIGWAPSVVRFQQLADPLRFVRVAEDWPAGTKEVAALLDEIGVPASDGMRSAAKALREANHKRRNEVVFAAQRYRR